MSTQRMPLPMDTPEPAATEPAATVPASILEAQDGTARLLQDDEVAVLEQQVVATLGSCFDPEIPVNIYELGLIYSIDVQPTGAVHIRMTLTSPACPVAGSLPIE